MTLTSVIILILATYRLVYMIQEDEGPFRIFFKLREKIGVIHNEDCSPVSWPETFLGSLIKCHFCVSIWVGGILTLTLCLFPFWTTWLCLPFAISGGSIFLREKM